MTSERLAEISTYHRHHRMMMGDDTTRGYYLSVDEEKECDYCQLLTALWEAQVDHPEWLCERENIVHPSQPGRTIFQPCPSCGDAMIPTSYDLRKIDALQRRVEGLEKALHPFAFPTEADGTFIVLGRDVNFARAVLLGEGGAKK